MHESNELHEIQLEHASFKYPETVGVVERSHSALKCILKLNPNEHWNDRFKCVRWRPLNTIRPIIQRSAVAPQLFHGPDALKLSDVRVSNALIERFSPNS